MMASALSCGPVPPFRRHVTDEEMANGPTRFSGWGRSSLGFLRYYQAETREGSSTIEKRTPAL